MTAAYVLLTLALNLLIAVQQPNVPPELRVYATQIANQAIAAANIELSQTASSTPVFGPIPTYTAPQEQAPTSTPVIAPTPAPVASAPSAPVLTLSVLQADQEDPGRWNNEKGHGCYRTTIYVGAYENGVPKKDVSIMLGTTTVQKTDSTNPNLTYNGIKMPVARFLFQPTAASPQTLVFTSGDATATYQCE